jgi:biotin-dependent carboxylase-like uncharacterized protein
MIEVLTPGGLSSIQDAGRRGYLAMGVGQSGAMDDLALAMGNAMLGNPADAAGIEVALCPFAVRFTARGLVAVTGAAGAAALDGCPLPPCWAFPVHPGQILELGPRIDGMWAYLTVAGGIDVPPVLGGRATDLKSRLGGLDGRGLRAGDCLAAGGQAGAVRHGFGAVPPVAAPAVRVMPAAEYDQFTPDSIEAFWTTPWTVAPDSNRIGYRLTGAVLRRAAPVELFSHGIVPGVVQVPPAGQPVIQTVEGNTAGGYPKIGVVIVADRWMVAQRPVGSALRFVRCDRAEAVAALRQRQAYLQDLARVSALARQVA